MSKFFAEFIYFLPVTTFTFFLGVWVGRSTKKGKDD